jgi:hypothetical protein
MPAGKPHKTIPIFTKSELDVAHDCATLLWNGINFETAKATTSDEQLMAYFSEPIEKYNLIKVSNVYFDRKELHELIIVAGLKVMLRKKDEISYPQFEAYLTNTLKFFQRDIKLSVNDAQRWAVASEYVREGGKQLVDVNVQTNAGYRVPLSSRVLFFALPTMPIANLSRGVAKALNLPIRAEYAVRPFYRIFYTGLAANQTLLKAYSIPSSRGVLDASVYSQVKNSDWWHRRVLDIAILLKFNVSSSA